MNPFLVALLFCCLATSLRAETEALVPTTKGTTWEYNATETITGAAPTESTVSVRVDREKFNGKEVAKFETLSNGAVTKVELMTVNEKGITCLARGVKQGKIVKLTPPEAIIVAPLKAGETWEAETEVAGIKTQQHWKVLAEENVSVPAGQFRAFHLQSENSALMSIKIDRWFVPGTGVVKESTVIKGPGMLQRVALDLQKLTDGAQKSTPSPTPPEETPEPALTSPATSPAPPETTAEQAPSPVPATSPMATAPEGGASPTPVESESPAPDKKLTVEVSDDPAGGLKTEFKSNATNIYVRWHGHGLPEGARIRVAWVAEDVGDLVETNFVIDETETVAPTPDASARFTLGRPPDGWAEGKYRVEFYLNDQLTESVRVIIQ